MIREYVPFEAYGLLRRIVGRGPQRVRHDRFDLDNSADYLVTRGLATTSHAGERIQSTEAGRTVGMIEWEPPAA